MQVAVRTKSTIAVAVELEREREDECRRRQLLVRHPARVLGEAVEVERDVARAASTTGGRNRARDGPSRHSTTTRPVRSFHGRHCDPEARRAQAARRLSRLRGADPREAARVPRLGRHLAEAEPGARRDARVLRDLVLERAPRRLHAVGARDRGLRGRPREGPRVPERAVHARGDLRPPGDRGAQPRRLRVGARQPRPGRRRDRHRARAPLELRARGSRSRSARAPSSG